MDTAAAVAGALGELDFGGGPGQRPGTCPPAANHVVSHRLPNALLLGIELDHRLAAIIALQRVPELLERLQPTFGPL